MNLKRYARGPFLYIVLALIVVFAVTSGLRSNGGYKTSDTATVLSEITKGNVGSSAKDNKLLDKEQQVKIETKDGRKLEASFLVDQGRDFAAAFKDANVKYDVTVTHEN